MTHTPGPWFVSGVRFKMNGGEWHGINRYDEAKKQDENIACVGYDPRTGLGLPDARLIAAAPDLLAALWRAEDAVEQLCIGQDPANECWNVLTQIRAALSKAQVQS